MKQEWNSKSSQNETLLSLLETEALADVKLRLRNFSSLYLF